MIFQRIFFTTSKLSFCININQPHIVISSILFLIRSRARARSLFWTIATEKNHHVLNSLDPFSMTLGSTITKVCARDENNEEVKTNSTSTNATISFSEFSLSKFRSLALPPKYHRHQGNYKKREKNSEQDKTNQTSGYPLRIQFKEGRVIK